MGIRRFYSDVFYIHRYTVQENAYTGAEEKTYVKDTRSRYGNLQPVSALKQSGNREDSLNVTDTLVCDCFAVTVYDRIEIDGNMYYIKGRPNDPANRGHHIEIELERIS